MENRKNIDQLVEETFESVSKIKSVKAPPFFKDKVLNKVTSSTTNEAEISYLNWLTPNYQAAILIALVLINTLALLSKKTDNEYDENIQNFAQVYHLLESDSDSSLYQN